MKMYANCRKCVMLLIQEVVLILEKYLSSPLTFKKNPTEEFLSLAGSWEDDISAEEIVQDIRLNRRNSSRFRNTDEYIDHMDDLVEERKTDYPEDVNL